MWVANLGLTNIRGFKSVDMNLSKSINVIVGENNSGKSTLLRSLLMLQETEALRPSDMRKREIKGRIVYYFSGELGKFLGPTIPIEFGEIQFPKLQRFLKGQRPDTQQPLHFEKTEPNNFIYPYLSNRKAPIYSQEINLNRANSVLGNFENIYAKIDRISNPEFKPANEYYTEACAEILGYQVTCQPSPNGKIACYTVRNMENIPVDSMGEGVINIVGLLADLCVADGQLFLIEELENDIHPRALKKLLSIIADMSQNNQFVLTTHSNIVTKYLGAQPGSKVFNVSMTYEDSIPTSIVDEVSNSPEERRKILENLGYEFYDLDLWSAWLFLEESSAEKIIREYLIPWFLPKLQNRLRTFSARTVDEINLKFDNFNNLFVFLNLEQSYKNKVWVIVDDGEHERKILLKLKETYAKNGWKEEQFMQFESHDFEKYYPPSFQDEVDEILAMQNKKGKHARKIELLNKILLWIEEDKDRAKKEFKKSAKEVLTKLKLIESKMLNEN